jgi:acetolactate synthase regulatory subunit
MEKKKVALIVEDNPVELEKIKNALKVKGFTVLAASGTSKADDLIEIHGKEIDIAIIDLNMSNEFLEEGLRAKTEIGALTGWVWFYNEARPKLRDDVGVAIYSAFIRDLEKIFGILGSDEAKYYQSLSGSGRIALTSKEGAVNDIDILYSKINEIMDR